MAWLPYADEHGMRVPRGSEGGVIVLDEEYNGAARITLEEDTKAATAAITCGLYGWVAHTRYFTSVATARGQYEIMKSALAELVSLVPDVDDPETGQKSVAVLEAIESFVERYP